MYNLDNVVKDFPWTRVTYNRIEPWREEGSNWFNTLPAGWGDVIYNGLVKLDHLLQEHNAKDRIVIEQVKEKWGSLRFYSIFLPREKEISDEEYAVELAWQDEFYRTVNEMENETMRVCYNCGTRDNIQCYGGWVHFACPACEKKRIEEFHL